MADYQLRAILTAQDRGLTATIKRASQTLSGLQKGIGDIRDTNIKAKLGVEGIEKINRLTAQLKEAGMNTRPISVRLNDAATSKLDSIRSKLSSLTGKAHNVAVNIKANGLESLNRAKDSISNVMSGASMAAGVATLGVGAGAGYIAAQSAKTYMDFEYQMKRNKALFTTGLDSETAQRQYKALEEAARHYGSTMIFTAQEVGKAQEYMALAGWNADTAIAALPSVLKASVASGEDLALVSDIITDDMTAMGYKAGEMIKNAKGEDVESAAHFVDVMLRTTLRSNTDFQKLGLAMKYIAPLAHTYGANIEDVAVALGVLANNGIKADQAGTGLRGIFTRLAAPTKQSFMAMQRLGVEFDRGDGNAKNFLNTLMEIRDKMRGGGDVNGMLDFVEEFTGEEIQNKGEISEFLLDAQARGGLQNIDQSKLAKMLSGQYALSAFLALVQSSDEDWKTIIDEIYNRSDGTADEINAEMMDTLKGDLKTLESAWADFNIELFEGKGASGVREFVQGLTKDINNFKTALKDGLDISDIVGLGIDVLTQLKNKFLELDGIGSLLAGGALTFGLTKILRTALRVKETLSQWSKIRTPSDAGNVLRGGITSAPTISSVGTMNVKAGVVNVAGAIKGGVPTGGTPGGTTARGTVIGGTTSGTVSGSQYRGVVNPAAVSNMRTNYQFIQDQARAERFSAVKSAAGGAAAFSTIFGLLDVYQARQQSAANITEAESDIAYQKQVLKNLLEQNRSQEVIEAQMKEVAKAEEFLQQTREMNQRAERQSEAGAAGSVAGSVIGAALGSIVPGVGTMFGGMLGGMVGGTLGQIAGVKMVDSYYESQDNGATMTHNTKPEAEGEYTDPLGKHLKTSYERLHDESYDKSTFEESSTESLKGVGAEGIKRHAIHYEQPSQESDVQTKQQPEITSTTSAKTDWSSYSTEELRKMTESRFAGMQERAQGTSYANVQGVTNPDNRTSTQEQWDNEYAELQREYQNRIAAEQSQSKLQSLKERFAQFFDTGAQKQLQSQGTQYQQDYQQGKSEGLSQSIYESLKSGVDNFRNNVKETSTAEYKSNNAELTQKAEFGESNLQASVAKMQAASESFSKLADFWSSSVNNTMQNIPDYQPAQATPMIGLPEVEIPELPDFHIAETIRLQVDEAKAAWEELKSSALYAVEGLSADFDAGLTSIRDSLTTTFGEIPTLISGGLESARSSITTAFSGASAEVQAIWSAIPGFFGGIFGGLGGIASAAGSAIAAGVNSGIGMIQSAWEGLSGWLSSKIASLSSMAASAASMIGINVGSNYTGTSNWAGGWTEINEHGGELIYLPTGTRILPHATTKAILKREIHNRLDNDEDIEIPHHYMGTSYFRSDVQTLPNNFRQKDSRGFLRDTYDFLKGSYRRRKEQSNRANWRYKRIKHDDIPISHIDSETPTNADRVPEYYDKRPILYPYPTEKSGSPQTAARPPFTSAPFNLPKLPRIGDTRRGNWMNALPAIKSILRPQKIDPTSIITHHNDSYAENLREYQRQRYESARYGTRIDKEVIEKLKQPAKPQENLREDSLGNILGDAIPEYNRITADDSIMVARAKREAQLAQLREANPALSVADWNPPPIQFPKVPDSTTNNSNTNTNNSNSNVNVNISGVNINNGMDFDAFMNQLVQMFSGSAANSASA